MELTELQKEYCRMNGWEKKKGILIDLDAIDDSGESYFVPDDCKEDYYKEGELWCEVEGNDVGVYEDEDIIDHIEDFAELSFKEWKKRKEESA